MAERIRISFKTSNPEIQKKLEILNLEYGISVSGFISKAIAEKLRNLGCEIRPQVIKKKPAQSIAQKPEKYDEMEAFLSELRKISLPKKHP